MPVEIYIFSLPVLVLPKTAQNCPDTLCFRYILERGQHFQWKFYSFLDDANLKFLSISKLAHASSHLSFQNLKESFDYFLPAEFESS